MSGAAIHVGSAHLADIPAIIQRAVNVLQNAQSAAEVFCAVELAGLAFDAAKRAARFAKAKGAHDDLVASAYRLQADALQIETQAKRRLAEEYDALQERGEVGQSGARTDLVPSGNEVVPSAANLGLNRKDIHEARSIRDAERADPGVVRRALDDALAAGDVPTRAAIKREILQAAQRIRAERAEVRREARTERLIKISNANAPLPSDRRFPIVHADPPYRYDHPFVSREIENHYPTMDLESICALPVASIATPDAMLFLWVPSPLLPNGPNVIESWGFDYLTGMVWDKLKIGMGIYARQRHEHLLIARRGHPIVPNPSDLSPSVIAVERGEHSVKPDEFYRVIERMYPALPKIELFARRPRAGWAVWGNQSGAAVIQAGEAAS